ncbi:head-tail connector protein [Niallia sp. RD1]|uniref:head-tail connector protein n=1 Tax=Niallia sp. RD1 TaxID=2962858 RepID=UPI0020C1B87D|nr:head-tail connector protein [Niallia sp. RD1]UTI44431.1 head-tail connector protein [Niallia sp. RD1]
MKISDLVIQDLKDYARVYHDEDDQLFESILIACQSFVKNYTGLPQESIDLKEDLTIALMVLANEMYDNRTMTVQNDKVNFVVKSILDMHSINLL